MESYEFTPEELRDIARLSYLYQKLRKSSITKAEDIEMEELIENIDCILPVI